MTTETTATANGVADPAAIAALTTPSDVAAEAATEAPTAAPVAKPPSFDDMDLHPDIKQALDEMGYFAPTAVQTAVYKPVSEGKDLLVQSRTGTGKTTAFGLPTLSKIIPTHRAPQAMILAPTRELALQVARELTNIAKHRGIVVEAIYGGAPIGKQIENLKNGVHVIVGTPGRVLDHIGRRTLDTRAITTFVLDECDEMLSMGFLEDIERVVATLPSKKQTLLFSATMPDEVSRYARRHMVAPEQISLSRDSMTVSDIHHAYYIVSGIARSRDLLKVLFAEEPESAIIFCNMRDETTMVAKFLQKQGLDAEPLSSDLSQADRERVMGRMKAKTLRYLCATDVAARGIDISSLSHVINFSVPESPEVYVHRTGRTGRAGKKGTAISLVGPRELGNFRYVRLSFGLKPEERLLPKDDVFEGKLKVPLPPVGVPTPPDPVQILIRGIQGTPTDLEMKIFEKLNASQAGKRALAKLAAERLDQLTTRTKPRFAQRPERTEAPAPTAAAFAEERPAGEREERPRREYGDRDRGPRREGGDRGPRRFDGDRGPRPEGDRPRFDSDRGPRPEGDRGPRPEGDRPRFDGDRGPRPEGDRPRFDADRGPRPEGDRGPRPEGDRGPRTEGDRGPRPEGDRPRFDGDRGPRPEGDRGPRPEGDRERRPWRDRDGASGGGGGDDRPRRFDRDRDRGGRPDRGERTDAPAAVPAAVVTAPTEGATEAPATAAAAPTETTTAPEARRDDRGGRDRHERGGRDRHERGGRDRHEGRERHARTDQPGEQQTLAMPAPAPAPVVEPVAVAPAPAPVEAAPAPKADDGAKKGKRDKKAEPTSETREFWETWAEEKTTRAPGETEPAAAAPAKAADEPTEGARGGRGRGRDRGGRGEKRGVKAEAVEAEAVDTTTKADKAPAKADKAPAGRGKRETAPPPAAAAPAASADSSQARLFVSLGKKHGVSADDLRALLAGPVGGDKARIGSVSLRDSHAHVRVPEDMAEAIIAGVHGTQHNDQAVTVERARA